MRMQTVARVLHVVRRNPVGGKHRMVSDLLSVLTKDPSIEVHVALTEDRDYTGDFSFDGAVVGITHVRGSTLSKIIQLIKLTQGYGIIHLHGFVPWEALAATLSGRTIVYTNHGLMGTGRRLESYEYLKRWMAKLFLRYVVDCIANVSSFALDRLVELYKISSRKNTVVYNCTRWEASEPRFAPSASLRIGFHGRFVAFKRLDRFIDVATEVAKELNVVVCLVGDGPLRDHVVRVAHERGLRTEIIGYRENLCEVVESFDVELITSDEENFGLAVLESIQAGHPTFVFRDSGGCVEIFDESTSWFVCGNQKEMAEKILSLQDDAVRKRTLELLAVLQKRVSTMFSVGECGHNYRNVYLDCLAGSS